MQDFEQEVLDKLERIATAQELNAKANAEFQKAMAAILTQMVPSMLAMFGQAFGSMPVKGIPNA